MLGCCQPIMLPISCAVIGWEVALHTYEELLIINDASVKKCSAQARLPGSLKPCAETVAWEDRQAFKIGLL